MWNVRVWMIGCGPVEMWCGRGCVGRGKKTWYD